MSAVHFFQPKDLEILDYSDKTLRIKGTVIIPNSLLFESGAPDQPAINILSEVKTLDLRFTVEEVEIYRPVFNRFKHYTFKAGEYVFSFTPGVHNWRFSELERIIDQMVADGTEKRLKFEF